MKKIKWETSTIAEIVKYCIENKKELVIEDGKIVAEKETE